ncbi:MAG: hypothetical protein CEN87_636 [Parcubacteria group bacterium Licking1014_1]|nr:MAG: hypothetical protein CEN87_636 [Parcubacteria group bacterium Licking1014_1]
MFNPEMGPREPEEEIPREETGSVENIESINEEQQRQEKVEKEQTPEEVLAVINEAIEKGREVLLTQAGSDGIITNIATPYSIEGNFLTIEAGGYGFDIKIDSIKKAEIVEKEEQEISPEDFREMLSQIPALKEMLAEREKRLQGSADSEEIKTLETEIEELRQEIAGREELLEE